jgi:hypothetical protein
MDKNIIKERIAKLKATLHELTTSHDAMVAKNQASNQEFQETVSRNQARFQQLNGAIVELEDLIKEEGNVSNGNN